MPKPPKSSSLHGHVFRGLLFYEGNAQSDTGIPTNMVAQTGFMVKQNYLNSGRGGLKYPSVGGQCPHGGLKDACGGVKYPFGGSMHPANGLKVPLWWFRVAFKLWFQRFPTSTQKNNTLKTRHIQLERDRVKKTATPLGFMEGMLKHWSKQLEKSRFNQTTIHRALICEWIAKDPSKRQTGWNP